MIDANLRFLTCPHCGGELARDEQQRQSLVCGRGHTFDVARQGYVSLLGGKGRSVPGDMADMVRARAEFLAAGHFAPIATGVADTCERELARAARERHNTNGVSGPCPATLGNRCIVDVGAGTGYYLNAVQQHVTAAGQRFGTADTPGAIAVDVSKPAMRHAARTYPELAAVVADARHTIPVAAGSAAVVIAAFAPHAAGELERVLAPEGRLVVTIPRSDHLAELAEPLGLLGMGRDKQWRLERQLAGAVSLADDQPVSFGMQLRRVDVRRLVQMGPSARHQSAEETEARLASLPEPVSVTASISVLTYRRS